VAWKTVVFCVCSKSPKPNYLNECDHFPFRSESLSLCINISGIIY